MELEIGGFAASMTKGEHPIVTAFKDAWETMSAPLGGAQSWDQLDAFRATQAESAAMADVLEDFSALQANVLGSALSPADKSAALAELAGALVDRFKLAAAQKARAGDPVLGYMDMIAPGAAQLVVAGVKAARRVTIDDYLGMLAPARRTKAIDPWALAATSGGAK